MGGGSTFGPLFDPLLDQAWSRPAKTRFTTKLGGGEVGCPKTFFLKKSSTSPLGGREYQFSFELGALRPHLGPSQGIEAPCVEDMSRLCRGFVEALSYVCRGLLRGIPLQTLLLARGG